MLRDASFRTKRDEQLLKIINNWEVMITDITEKVLLKNKKVILKGDDKAKSTLYRLEHLKEVLNFHKGLAKNYLDYNKVYITRRLENSYNYFTIYNDSFSSIYLKSIKIKNSEGVIFNRDIDKYFPSLNIDKSLIALKKQFIN